MGFSFRYIYIVFVAFIFLGFTVDRNSFYKTLSSGDLTQIKSYVLQLENETKTATNNAYWGALTAKKANFEKGAAQKIKIFKTGIKKLELEITNHPKNVEYRFLRLSIQEHCPKILKYNKNIQEDTLLIRENFSKQNASLKRIILDYAQQSKNLDLKTLK